MFFSPFRVSKLDKLVMLEEKEGERSEPDMVGEPPESQRYEERFFCLFVF